MSNSYEIRTLSDLLKVPSDRLHDCMAELADAITLFKAERELLEVETDLEFITWHDDNKTDQRHSFYFDDGKELRFDFKADAEG
ncbi:hypothetical protein [Acinetobacter higginsii]|uniref:hypothetical protein n=1 Tax=Acinetobacter higginsii TaxID=70347 RepID=UPI00300B2DC7